MNENDEQGEIMFSRQVKEIAMNNNPSRRDFLADGLSLFAAGSLVVLYPGVSTAQSGLDLTPSQHRSLMAALKKSDDRYDPAVRMLRSSVSGVGYHTTLQSGVVHPTRGSLQYAVGLLDSGEQDRLERAKAILQTVIALQDKDPESRTYGIWSWYLEEPLDRMSPPDWNWADFCGVQLLAAWIDHRERIGEDLAQKVKESIIHAARSIQRRNVGPGYTNIAIMGTYVTLVASDRFNMPDLEKYAKKRLRRLHHHVMEQGSFSEYNSPTYSIVAIAELSRMLMHVKDQDDLELIRAMANLAWRHVATHFHPPTRQWAGPHSRCYSTDLRKRERTLAFLEKATHGGANLISEEPLPIGLDYYRLPIQCPEEYIHDYKKLENSKEVIETFIKSSGSRLPITGTTFLHPEYALGTVNQGDFWRQKRSIIAYWGTPEKPAYLHVRFLHDGYDYTSAMVFNVQYKGDLLSSVVFATDYGDTHPSLDRVRDATIKAKDLRLRFEFGAEIQDLQIENTSNLTSDDADIGNAASYKIGDRNMNIHLVILGCSFGDYPIRFEQGANEENTWIDLVYYSGEEKEIDFSTLSRAFITFIMRFQSGEPAVLIKNGYMMKIKQDKLNASWNTGQCLLALTLPSKPDKRRSIQESFSMTIDHQ